VTASAKLLLGLTAPQWVALLVALLALLITIESWIGHYRSGFPLRAQYAPLAISAILMIASVAAAVAPTASPVIGLLRVAGWTAVVAGVVGVGYHHYFGILKKAGGYHWLLHYLMYGAPQLAPLALSAAGILGVLSAAALAGQRAGLGDADLGRAMLGVVSIALAGAVLQSGILHYRGAFNTPLMYVPITLPPLAAVAVGWLAVVPHSAVVVPARVLLWLTVLAGFVGLGMHLRGLDRQMGGLRLFLFNVLQGPPLLAPAAFASLAAVGLVAMHMLAV
jgi:hypothetical protein